MFTSTPSDPPDTCEHCSFHIILHGDNDVHTRCGRAQSNTAHVLEGRVPVGDYGLIFPLELLNISLLHGWYIEPEQLEDLCFDEEELLLRFAFAIAGSSRMPVRLSDTSRSAFVSGRTRSAVGLTEDLVAGNVNPADSAAFARAVLGFDPAAAGIGYAFAHVCLARMLSARNIVRAIRSGVSAGAVLAAEQEAYAVRLATAYGALLDGYRNMAPQVLVELGGEPKKLFPAWLDNSPDDGAVTVGAWEEDGVEKFDNETWACVFDAQRRVLTVPAINLIVWPTMFRYGNKYLGLNNEGPVIWGYTP